MLHRTTLALAVIVSSACATTALAQDRQLTLEEIYAADTDERISFSGSPTAITWLDADRYLQRTEEDDGLLSVDARSGESTPHYDPEKMSAALAKLPGMSADQAAELSKPGAFRRSDDHTKALIEYANDLFYYEFGSDVALRLTNDPAPEIGAEFSPDGTFVSFVRNYNLHLCEVATQRERALTDDGGPELFYGRLDWVYQEEVYGRGNFKGYWWSPDSTHITFLKLDESPVREFTVVDHLPTRLETEVTNYPKAGDPNPKVWLGVVPTLGGDILWLDTEEYEPIEHLIVSVDWTPDSAQIVFQVQDREQRWLDLNVADPSSGETRRVLHEETPAWVDLLGAPHWLEDGTFLWFSQRTGYKHLYRYDVEGELKGAVTSGEWEARSLHGVDEENGWVYYTGNEHSPIANQVYRIRLDGSERTRVSRREGTHAASFAPDFAHYVDRWSDLTTPPKVTLHAADGKLVRAIDENPVPELAEYGLGEVELFQVAARDGFPMEAILIKPPGFDASRKYPVLQYQYSGPHAPVVRNSFGGARYMWHQMLAQKGYVIFMCDNRSASGKGIAPTWGAYQRLGVIEMRDIQDGVDWLKQQPWVDAGRIGIWGWSYGGFMTAFALTHSKDFKVGVCGAPVTDWSLYDTIYTERYMRMPQNNPDGYGETSLLEAAGDLHGKLLLIHGTMDDNVHLQNSIRFIYELQQAGKEFDLMLYPRSRHSPRDPALVYHLQREMMNYVLENL